MKTKYTVDYFIDKFKAIPRNKWCTGVYEFYGQRCALGHCGETYGHQTRESMALRKLLPATTATNDQNGIGKHPRTRILNALKALKKK